MPLTLAIDCCDRAANAAIGDGGRVIAAECRYTGPKRSAILPTIVQSLADAAGASLAQIEHVAVTVGPGYYTGIRVGLAYASALAESVGAKLVPMTSLRAMAQIAFDTGMTAVPMIKAREGEVYAAAWRRGSRIIEERYCALESMIDAPELQGDVPPPLFICGDAEITSAISARSLAALHPVGAVAPAMLRAALSIRPVAPTDAQAVYLRPPS